MNTDTTENLDTLWGAEQIAAFVGVDVRKAFYLLSKGRLPANKCGGVWVTTRSRLRRHFDGTGNTNDTPPTANTPVGRR